MWRARLSLAIAALCLGVLARGAPAAAQERVPAGRLERRRDVRAPRELVLINAPAALERALRTALAPRGVRLSSVDRERAGATLPETATQAALLARELGTQTLVWLSSTGGGAALSMYEAETETLRVRQLPEHRPLDGTLAAALALSVKTWLLRASPASEPPAGGATAAPDGAPEIAGTRAARGASATDDGSAARPRAALLRVLLHAAARSGAVTAMSTEARYGGELRVAPWRSATGAEQLWLGARFDTAGPSEVTRRTIRGSYSDSFGGVSVGLSRWLAPTVSAGLHVGAALHRTAISGRLLPDETAAQRQVRWSVSAQLRPELEIGLGPVGVVLQGTVAAPLRQQVYTVDGIRRIETGTFWWMLGGALRVDVL